MPQLELTDVHVTLSDTPIVQGVSLTLGPGCIHGLVGPNGAGKSTLLRAIAGLVPTCGGGITFAGRNLLAMRPRERARNLAFVPQDSFAPGAFTVREVVTMGRYSHLSRLRGMTPTDTAAVADALAQVGLSSLAERTVPTLSGGQRQLTFFAKALAQSSRLLLLDEPVSALDIRAQLELLELINRLASQGHTILLVVHDLNLAARFCDTLTVMHAGRIAISDTPDQVLKPALLAHVYGVNAHVDTNPATLAPTVTALAALGSERKQ